MSEEVLVEMDSERKVIIPKDFCDELNLKPSDEVFISLNRNELTVRPKKPHFIKCFKCGVFNAISVEVPICKTCLNIYLTEPIKEKNSRK